MNVKIAKIWRSFCYVTPCPGLNGQCTVFARLAFFIESLCMLALLEMRSKFCIRSAESQTGGWALLYLGSAFLSSSRQSWRWSVRLVWWYSLRAGAFPVCIEPFLKFPAQFYTERTAGYERRCSPAYPPWRALWCLNGFHIAAGDHQFDRWHWNAANRGTQCGEFPVGILPFEELLADQPHRLHCQTIADGNSIPLSWPACRESFISSAATDSATFSNSSFSAEVMKMVRQEDGFVLFRMRKWCCAPSLSGNILMMQPSSLVLGLLSAPCMDLIRKVPMPSAASNRDLPVRPTIAAPQCAHQCEGWTADAGWGPPCCPEPPSFPLPSRWCAPADFLGLSTGTGL